MDDERITRIVNSINDVKQRKAARSGVNYRRGAHVPEAAILAWLTQGWPEAATQVLSQSKLSRVEPEPIREPEETHKLGGPHEITDADFEAYLARLIAEGTISETQARLRAESAEPSKAKGFGHTDEAQFKLGLAGRILAVAVNAGLCAVIAWQLSIATVPLYGVIPAVLLILLPMAFIFFIDARLVRRLVLIGFMGADLYSLEAMRQRDASRIEKSAASANPEYLRLAAEHGRIMLEREGLDSISRVSRLAELRRKAQDISDRMTALEQDILTDRNVTSDITTGKVTLLVRVLFLVGLIVLGHALPKQLRSFNLAFGSKKP